MATPVVVDNSDIGHGDFERIACIVFICVTPLFLIARFISRITSKQLGNDDWASLAAFVFVMNCNIVTLISFNYGWGRHKKNLTPRNLEICLIFHWIFQITYKLAVAMNKISILLLFLRIMPQRYYRIASYSLMVLVGLFAFATTIAGVFQCIPVHKAWNKHLPGHCYRLVDAWYSNAVFSIITDLLILMLPMHMVYNLQRDKREKMLLYGVFGLGIFVTFTSIWRFFELKSAKNPDTTYDINSGYWSIIEINVGVICVCLPPLHSLLARQFKFMRQKRSRVTGDSDGPYHHAGSNANSELVTIGGSGPAGRTKDRKRQEPEDSEEELVYSTKENSVTTQDTGIMKKTEFEFAVTERAVRPSRDRDIEHQSRMKPWELQPHAS